MAETRDRRAAGVILFRAREDATEYLLLRNARHHTWGFPKGHLEEGETDEAAARREVEEETGLTGLALTPGFREVVAYTVATPAGPAQKEVVYFLAELAGGEIRRSPEHDRDAWATREKVKSLLVHDNLRELFLRADAAVIARVREAP